MKTANCHIPSRMLCILLSAGIWTGAFILLKAKMGYMLCYLEQRQMFLFSASYLTDLCGNVGGTASYLANFITQFMVTPVAGALTITVCSILVSLLLYRTFRQSVHTAWLLPVSAVISYIPILLIYRSYGFEIEAAAMVSVALSAIFTRSRMQCGWLKAAVWSTVSLFFYYLIGPGIFIAAALMVLVEILRCRKEGLKMLTLPAAALSCAVVSVAAGQTGTYSEALSLSAYRAENGARKENSRCYELEWLTCHGEWKKIMECTGGAPRNWVESNYMNLALAEKGILADSLLHYPQRGPYSLVNSNHGKDELSMVALSHILYAAGDYAGAQSMAFSVSADRKFSFGHPYMMKMVRDVDLIRGSDATADRYDAMFSKTLHYAHWAGDHSLPEGAMKSFEVRDFFSLYGTPYEDFNAILDANPENHLAAQYAVSYAVLTKDISEIRSFVERWFATPVLNETLPRPVAESLLFYTDFYASLDEEFASSHGIDEEEFRYMKSLDRDYCHRLGIGEDVTADYSLFKEKFDRYGTSASPSAYSEFKNTFWYYLLFVKI